MKIIVSALIVFFYLSITEISYANKLNTDTLKTNPTDTSKIKKLISDPVNKYVKDFKGKIIPKNSFGQAKAVKNQLDQAQSALTKRLNNAAKGKLGFSLTLEDAIKYQPLPQQLNSNSNQKFVNTVAVLGNIEAWGIPFNFNFSNAHNDLSDLNALRNSLFKFDFNPAQFTDAFKSDLQQYYDIRKNAFAGLDLTGYTQKALKEKLNQQVAIYSNKAKSSIISKYLDKQENITELLGLNQQQIREKLQSVIEDKAKKNISSLNQLKGIDINHPMSFLSESVKLKALQRLKLQTSIISNLSNNSKLAQYFSDPGKVKELQLMNEDQIVQQLSALTANNSAIMPINPDGIDIISPIPGFKLSEFIKNVSKEGVAANDTVIKGIARKIFLSRTSGNRIKIDELLDQKKQQLGQQLSAQVNGQIPGLTAKMASTVPALDIADKTKLNKEIDSVAQTITSLKSQLQKKGIDINKMLLMQKSLNNSIGSASASEMVNGFLSKRPQNAIQSIFTRVQALKLGSFGNKAPGNTTGGDLFMDGTHVTYKTGNIPITIGYGGINDISANKDANYQNSDYNSPKTITYLSAGINKGVFGNAKISIIGSSGGNGSNNYNSYTVPTSSSTNVALTISKSFNTGKIGKFSFDVSKSSTLYSNNYTSGTDAVLEQKSGLNYQESNIAQALSFGLTHQLEVKQANLTENFYFNYAGIGYQNPGNNGFGGGGLKLGGNVKKSLYKNKLVLSIRTDIKNKAINYTSNDQWKNYQVQFDSRYNINKKFNITIKYSAGGTDKQIDNITTPVYSSRKLQFDGNASYKIGKHYTVSHMTIGKQDYANSYVSQTGSSLLMVNYTQSLMLNHNSLTASVFYNKELSSNKLIGNLLNSDFTYQYTIFQKVNMSSAVTYLNNAGIVSQAGIRQSIQLMAGTHFDLDTYIDVRKNLITPLYPDLYASCRAELSLKYHLKN